MFSGIVQTVGKIESIKDKNHIKTIRIETHGDYLEDIAIGQSVSVDGVCLSLVKKNKEYCEFEAVEETINRTTLGSYKQGTKVNLEKSLKFGDTVGGHFVSGHIHTKGRIVEVELIGESKNILVEIEEKWIKYLTEKGYISVNGASITIGKVSKNTFYIHLIPETLRTTNLDELIYGNYVNLEFDQTTIAIVDTTERLINQKR
ncbi:riboflavin synthase subunit alpha [SAR86 cluster bacterium]|uniref:Riboflavin synthase n=1 Tax=SAR86 cluster bacterium TaxID=2030880 RepID=A0A9Q8TY28_9GAMM|nr:riboflavin synthase subunit alpha [SAR86 cluster bacterium]